MPLSVTLHQTLCIMRICSPVIPMMHSAVCASQRMHSSTTRPCNIKRYAVGAAALVACFHCEHCEHDLSMSCSMPCFTLHRWGFS